MGVLLQIRDVPEETRRVLKVRAAAQGRSLNSYLLDLLVREVTRPTADEVFDRATRRAERAAVSAVEAIDAARTERDGELRRAE
jgi:plasmid stability protein